MNSITNQMMCRTMNRRGFCQASAIVAGENRGDPNSRQEFSAIGQQRAGLMWFAGPCSTVHEETFR